MAPTTPSAPKSCGGSYRTRSSCDVTLTTVERDRVPSRHRQAFATFIPTELLGMVRSQSPPPNAERERFERCSSSARPRSPARSLASPQLRSVAVLSVVLESGTRRPMPRTIGGFPGGLPHGARQRARQHPCRRQASRRCGHSELARRCRDTAIESAPGPAMIGAALVEHLERPPAPRPRPPAPRRPAAGRGSTVRHPSPLI